MSVAFRVPELGEGVYEAELVEWKVQPGDTVAHGETLAEVMTDKATMELPSPFSGRITALNIEPGATFHVGDEILEYEEQDSGALEAATAPSSESHSGQADDRPTAAGGNGSARSGRTVGEPVLGVKAAPSVRRMARALGVDLRNVPGSGKGGRILIDDLAGFVRRQAPEGTTPTPSKPSLAVDLGRAGTVMTLQGLRRKIAEHLVESARSIPHYSYIDECCVTRLVELHRELEGPLADRGIKLTYLTFWVRAVVRALKQIPIANATYDAESEQITLHDRYDIGIATATKRGLVVPVLRNADRLTIPETAWQIQRLVEDVRQHRVTPDQLRGSTFTITSIGSIGGLISTPILNAPEVGIMGVGQIRRRPDFDADGNVVPADYVYLSFSFDHRIVDGAVAALFGNAVISALSHPARMLLT